MVASFGTYFCMYAFRKPLSTGVYTSYTLFGIGYKTCIIISQVLGYMLSKFIGIKVISELRASLLRVLKTREPDQMPIVRYDVQGARGPFQARWWQVVNTPILGDDGFVKWIIHRAEDVTEIVELRQRLAEAFPTKK